MTLRIEDCEILANLHSECFPNKKWSAADFWNLQKSGADIIAFENSFIAWRRVLDEAEIISIGVRPSLRRSGAATALLSLMEGDLLRRGVKKIFLEVAADNAPAIGLYEKNGFARIGVRPKYYGGTDAATMQKIIR
jgi:ribosomal-protein-alanine N-acetyltransferase